MTKQTSVDLMNFECDKLLVVLTDAESLEENNIWQYNGVCV